MVCPYCSCDSKVTNSRLQKRSNSVWRRRNCLKCGAVWTTVEAIQAPTTYRVSKHEQVTEFKPETLLISLYEALRHKKTAEQDAAYVLSTVMQKLQAKKLALWPTELITQTAYDVLRRYDAPAGAVYKARYVGQAYR